MLPTPPVIMKVKGVDACKALSIMPSLTVFLEKTETEDAFYLVPGDASEKHNDKSEANTIFNQDIWGEPHRSD